MTKKVCLFMTCLLFLFGCNSPQVNNVLNTIKINQSKEIEIPSEANVNDSDSYEVKKYSFFNTEGKHFVELVNEGYFKKAASLYGDNSDYFEKKQDKYSEQISAVIDYLNHDFTIRFNKIKKEINPYLNHPIDSNNWKDLDARLEEVENLKSKYYEYYILDPGYYSFKNQVESLKKQLYSSYEEKAEYYFSNFDLFNGIDFFSVYPYEIEDKESFIENNIGYVQDTIKNCSCKKLEILFSTYYDYIDVEKCHYLSNVFLDKYIKENSDEVNSKNELLLILDAIEEAKENRFIFDRIDGKKVSFLEATSSTLLNEGYIEFPVSVNVDLPFEHKKIEFKNSIFDDIESRYIVIFDVSQASIKRRIMSNEKVSSKFLSGHREEYNPNFKQVQVNLREIERGLASAQGTYCGSGSWAAVACEVGKGISIGGWRKKLNIANQAYVNTPEYIQKEVYSNYSFKVSDVYVTKSMTVNYYIVDRINKSYYKSTFDTEDKNTFKIAYAMRDDDYKSFYYKSQYDDEEKIQSYEEKTVKVDLSALMKDYANNYEKVKPLKNESELIAKILIDKNKILEKNKKEKIITKPNNDKRFNHVVVIYNPNGGLGTGFFVEPHMILTNYHVVEGSKFLEMKLQNGLETFGKIVKSDIRLDLALIRVEAQGEPVEFYDSNSIDLGREVLAIGHPNGLEFSITRGIVSAIREQPSVYDVGGKDVTFIQTDAAINPGNSGGPLFYGDKVIGVNNQKLVSGSIEGLGFAIHCNEVKSFLKESY